MKSIIWVHNYNELLHERKTLVIGSLGLCSVLKHSKKSRNKAGDRALLYSDWLLTVFRDLRVGTLEVQLTGETHWVSFDRLPQI